jgi:hypothetical protein
VGPLNWSLDGATALYFTSPPNGRPANEGMEGGDGLEEEEEEDDDSCCGCGWVVVFG